MWQSICVLINNLLQSSWFIRDFFTAQDDWNKWLFFSSVEFVNQDQSKAAHCLLSHYLCGSKRKGVGGQVVLSLTSRWMSKAGFRSQPVQKEYWKNLFLMNAITTRTRTLTCVWFLFLFKSKPQTSVYSSTSYSLSPLDNFDFCWSILTYFFPHAT